VCDYEDRPLEGWDLFAAYVSYYLWHPGTWCLACFVSLVVLLGMFFWEATAHLR
jgi:hypothetical protein